MIALSVLKAITVGFCAAAPIGPVALLVMQQTLEKGRKGGLVAGLGSMCADTLFAAAGLLTIAFIRQFVDRNTLWIYLVGGAIVTAIGLLMLITTLRRRPAPQKELDVKSSTGAGYAVRTFLSALANPVALAVMIALLSFFKVSENGLPIWLDLVLVACGEMLWWTLVTRVVLLAGNRMSPNTVRIINAVLGGAVAVFGIVLVIKGLIIIL